MRFVLKRHGSQHWSEHFLVCQRVIRWHGAKKRGHHVVAIGWHAWVNLTLCQHGQAAGLGLFDEPVHALLLRRVDHRPAVQVHLGRTHANLFEFFRDESDKPVMNRLLHQQSTAGRAGLPRVLNDAAHHRGGCQFEVGIFKHQMGRFATQL